MRPTGILLAGLLAAAAMPGLAQKGAVEADETSRRLNRVFLDWSIASRPLFPLAATANGQRAYDDQFANDLTEEHRERQREWCRNGLAALEGYERERLGDNDRLSYDIFRYNLQRCLARLAIDFHLMPIDQGGWSLPATFPVFGSGRGAHPFRNTKDYENFLKRIPGFVEWMDTAIANMRRGMARGFTQPRGIMESVVPQLSAMIVDDPAQSPFYQPIANMPEAIGAEDRERLTGAYRAAIAGEIVPAYRRLRDFVRDEYISRCRTTSGLSGLPGGERLYEYHIEAQTTTRLKPDEIMQIGRREMARIRQSIEELKNTAGYSGDTGAWAATLRAGAKRYSTVEETVAAYRAMHERVYGQLGRYFGRLPRAPYEIRPVEAYREDGAASQYWRAGPGRPAVFYVNLRALKKEPVSASMGLFLHETLPGHHMQMALAQENRELPNFRRVMWYAAYGEGWALYAESLGLEMGLYDDAYERLAWLNGGLAMAARLVADTGIHARGWSREQAMKFMTENTLDRHLYADYERGHASMVERFMSQPAFSLAYMLGELKIRELRAKAESALGPRFDLRAFHDEILKDGAMPLDILEAKIARWIAAQSGD